MDRLTANYPKKCLMMAAALLLCVAAAKPPAKKVVPPFVRGMDLYRAKNYVEAEKQFREVSRDDPDYLKAVQHLGMSLYQRKKYDEALPVLMRFYEPAGPKDPLLAATFNSLIVIHRNGKSWESILTLTDSYLKKLEPAVDFVSARTAACDQVFRVLREDWKSGGITGDFLVRVIREYPANRNVPWAVDTLFASRKTDPAETEKLQAELKEIFTAALEKTSEPGERAEITLRQLDVVYRGREETEELNREKAALYAEAAARYPESPGGKEALRKEADIYKDRLNEYGRAAALYETLVRKREQPWLLSAWAQCLVQRKEYAAAAVLWREQTGKNKKDENARQQLAQCLIESGAADEGAALCESMLAETTLSERTREKTADLLKECRPTVPAGYVLPTGCHTALFVRPVIERRYSANAACLVKGAACIGQERRKLGLAAFGPRDKVIEGTLKCSSAQGPSLADPYTVLCPETGRVSAIWDIRESCSPDHLRKPVYYGFLFPWRDITAPEWEIARTFAVDDQGQGLATVRITLPSPGWLVEIFHGSRAGALGKVTPEPERRLTRERLQFTCGAGTWQAELSFKAAPTLLFYYPRVRISRTVEADGTGPVLDYTADMGKETAVVTLPPVLEETVELDERSEYQ